MITKINLRGRAGIDAMSKTNFELKKIITSAETVTDYKKSALQGALNRTTEITYGEEADALVWQASKGASASDCYLFTDWSKYSSIRFSIYTEKAYGHRVQLRFSCPQRQGGGMAPYYRFQFPVNWIGWKEFCIDITDLGTNYSPSTASVVTLSFDSEGWDMKPNPECTLVIGNVALVAAKYEITPPLTDFGSKPFDEVKDNWRRLLVGTEETNCTGSEATKRIIAAIERDCEANLGSFRETMRLDRRDSLWGVEIVHGRRGDEYKAAALYGRLYTLVRAYGTPGNRYYKDPALLVDCKNGLEYLYRHYYGPCIIEQGPYGNWWEWDIGIPLALTKMLLILEDELGAEAVAKYLSPFDHLDYYPRMTAANKTWITACILASAVLQNDAERVLISKQMFIDVFDYVTAGDGFYTDGSFIQHGRHPYAGGYALSMMATLTDIMYAFNGTMFEITEGGVNNQYAWVFDTYLPIMHRGNLFANNRGREVSRRTSETQAGNGLISSLVKMIHYAPVDVVSRLEDIVKKHIATSGRDLTGVSSILFADYIAGLADSAEAANVKYNVTKVYGNMDRVTHHNATYAASVALNSTRIWKYEAINLENMNAWYHGDGMIYLYTHGYDYNYDFFHYVDPYRIPGVTCTDEERVMENISGGIFNGSPFAGGVYCGEYGAATLDLAPSENKYFIPKLSARKSYFFLGREVVAVGSGITDTSGANVYTVVENRKWREEDEVKVNGEAVELNTDILTKDAVNRVHFSGMGGYIFPDSVTLNMRRAENTVSFLEMWLGHGKSPENEGYSYIYLPTATAEETDRYKASAEIEILSATPALHAVKKSATGVSGYVFFEAGECGDVKVSDPCAVMTEEKDGSTCISVSDPTHLLESATVTVLLNGRSNIVAASENIKYKLEGNVLTMDIDFKDNVGQSFSIIAQSLWTW